MSNLGEDETSIPDMSGKDCNTGVSEIDGDARQTGDDSLTLRKSDADRLNNESIVDKDEVGLIKVDNGVDDDAVTNVVDTQNRLDYHGDFTDGQSGDGLEKGTDRCALNSSVAESELADKTEASYHAPKESKGESSSSQRDQSSGATNVDKFTGMPESSKIQPNPFLVKIEMDGAQMLLFLLALITRMWRLDHPNAVVFDEVLYMQQTALYLNRTFYFDHHPPLSKMLFALVGYLSGYRPGSTVLNVGEEYPPDIPVWYLRLLPALLGSLLIPVVYQIMVELRLKRWTAALAGTLILCENSFLTQSRLVMIESVLIFLMAVTILCLLKFRNTQARTKYIGVMTAILVLFIAFRDLWRMMADVNLTDRKILQHALSRIVCLVVIPSLLYLGVFYVHLTALSKAGTPDHTMTGKFQVSLEGGLAAITKGQPLYVTFGSQITIHHMFGTTCWLHSHDALYPNRYGDDRESSHQQQVTCYSYKDANNWWIVGKPDEKKATGPANPPQYIKHGDVVQFFHGLTGRQLNSHDVAAPMSPTQMEVSCYVDNNATMAPNTLWRVEILNRDNEGDIWMTVRSQVKLVHVATGGGLKISGQSLPEWGFGQLEVTADSHDITDQVIWNVEEHVNPKNTSDLSPPRSSELTTKKPVVLTFWQKFKELQMKMLTWRIDEEIEHRYCSSPQQWPLADKNVAYWLSPTGGAQIHLLGNIISWYSAVTVLIVFVSVSAAQVMGKLRESSIVWDDYIVHMIFVSEVTVGGYLLHYLPFFTIESTYFLYHYLPAVVFKLMFAAVIVEQIHSFICVNPKLRHLATGLIVAWLSAIILVFWQYLGISYGLRPYTNDELSELQLIPSWDFIMSEPV